ncbi:MAG: beta-porphyranase A, partial [Rikenellaceae bacterium]
MRTSRLTFACSVLAMLSPLAGVAQESTTKITFDPTVQRYIGDVTSLDRGKFFNLHGTTSSSDTELQTFFSDYGVGVGRAFWGPGNIAYQSTGEYGVYPSYATNPNTSVRSVTSGYICTQHPNDQGITKDMTDAEIQAAGEWAAEYFNNVASSPIAEYFEPFNEPFVHAGDGSFSGTTYSDSSMMMTKITEYFKQCAIAIHNNPALSNMKVIGYADAWPQYENTSGTFSIWESRMKMFMDAAGEYMDAYSIHIYDGINVVGEDTRRSGSNAEAVLDLVESYQYAAFGSKKPFVISEYGGIDSETSGLAYQDPGSNRTVGSLNHILFTLLEREDNLLHSIPFICDKSTWYITEANNYGSYGAVLMIPTTIPTSSVLTGLQWQYTPKVYFYELWKGVTGNRFDITTTNPDIQSIGFRDGSTIYIALDNLEDEAETVSLLNSATESTLSNIEIRRCESNYDQGILFSVEYPGTLPESITMQKDEAIIIKATLGGESTTSNAIRRNRYYSTSNLQAITASSTITYKFSGVPTTTYGRATARMSIGRDLSASKNPTFYVNGTQVSVPTDWKGYDQEPRGTTFFGMIEVPFSTSLLNESGEQTITMKFSDGGGYVSSVILDVEAYDYQPRLCV